MALIDEVGKLRKGLTSDQFKVAFAKIPEVEKNPTLLGSVDTYWNYYNTDLSEVKKKTGSGSGIGSALGGVSVGGIQDFKQSNVSALVTPKDVEDYAVKLGSAFFGKQGGFLEGIKTTFSTIFSTVLSGGVDILTKEVELRNKLNSQIGIAGELSRGYRDNIIGASDAAAGMGYSMDDVMETAISATEATGRFYTLSEKVMEDMSVTSRAFIGDMRDMGPILKQFGDIGVGAEKTLQNINEAGKSALTLGLNTRTTTAELQKNIGKINEYGFQNGVQGLASMVRKATEFRMSMESAFTVADKVLSPEGAIDLAANLQVLGGAVGSLGDPFQMMYMATNNVEGLQDALIGAASSLATYNTEQGRFEITGVNLRRAKQMASDLGISYQELSKGAIAAAERSSAAADLMTAGLKVDDKQQEFITNLARMGSGGKMIIDVPPSLAKKLGVDQQLALDSLDQTTADAILENQKAFEKMDTKDIALEQFTETQKMALNVSEIAQMLKVQFAETYRGYGSKIDEYIKKGNDILEGLKGKPETEEGKAVQSELNRIKAQNISTAAEEGKRMVSKIENPIKVDNKQKEKETTKTPENTPISVADMERIMNNVAYRNEKAIKENKSDTKVDVNSADSRDYVYIDIK